jgi:hypothetical protein
MPRYLVTTRRHLRDTAISARDAIAADHDVKLVNGDDPHMVTIETTEKGAAALASKLDGTHYVELELRRSLT